MALGKNTLKDLINESIKNKTAKHSISQGDLADRLIELVDLCMAEPIDVFLIAGQSNARGMSGPTGGANSPNPSPGTVFQFGNGNFLEVTNEVGDANTGSIWPSFAIRWVNRTARKICFVPRAVNATGLYSAADLGSGYWGEGGTLFQNSVDNVNDALAALSERGYQPVFCGVLWSQGENDAYAINLGAMTKQNYADELALLQSKYRAEFGPTMPFYIIKTGTRVGAPGPLTDDNGYGQIRDAQDENVAANPLLNVFIYKSTKEFVDRGLMMADGVHYGQVANNEIGRTSPDVILGGKDPI